MQDRNRFASRARAAIVVASGALITALACGCAGGVYAETAPPVYGEGYDTYYAETVPPNIYEYPRVYYNGSYAYNVEGRWYYPHGERWVVFRRPPPEIERQRPYVQQAPPAYRGYERGYERAPAPAYPPPAERVR